MKKIFIVSFLALVIMASAGVSNVFAAKKTADMGHTTCSGYGDVLYTESVEKNTIERSYYLGYMGGSLIGNKVWQQGVLTTDTVGVACANDL